MQKLKMIKHNMDGKLIVFCGLDGCGKTTMINMLNDYYTSQGKTVYLTKQPTDIVRKSDMFRNFMDSPNNLKYEYRSLSLLAASDRIQHSNKVILPALATNDIVISDRYIFSCIANLRARGYEKDKWIYEISKSIIKPDLTFFIDVSVETAIKRVRGREEEKNRYINTEFQEKLRAEYLKIAKTNGYILISSETQKEETFNIIKKYIEGMEHKDDN